MHAPIIYKSKSFNHKIIAKGVLIGLIATSLMALPLIPVYGLRDLTVYVYFKVYLLIFCIIWFRQTAKQWVFYREYFQRRYTYTKRDIGKPISYNEVESLSFRPIYGSVIGRLVVNLKNGEEILAIVPEDDLPVIHRELEGIGLPVHNIPARVNMTVQGTE